MKLTVELKLTPAQLAEAFCDMGDEEQAQFFIESARLAKSWPDPTARALQWIEVGHHLRDCPCSDDDAREIVADIFNGMQPQERAA